MLHRFRFPTGVTQIRRQKPPCCRFPTGITQVCRQIHASYRFRPPSPGLVLPSEELELRQRLDEFRLDKWNFVVYRCSYGDEKLWADFKDIWTREVRRHIAESDAPELGQSLTWTFFDDARTFTDVSKDELRRHFRDWASFAPAVEQPRAREPWCSIYSPRYRFFIHVDHEAMQSVLDHPQPAIHLEEGHVNLVDSKWRLEVEDSENEEDYDSLDHTYPPIDGCTSQEVGWMKMQYSRVAPETYNLLSFDDYACPFLKADKQRDIAHRNSISDWTGSEPPHNASPKPATLPSHFAGSGPALKGPIQIPNNLPTALEEQLAPHFSSPRTPLDRA